MIGLIVFIIFLIYISYKIKEEEKQPKKYLVDYVDGCEIYEEL